MIKFLMVIVVVIFSVFETEMLQAQGWRRRMLEQIAALQVQIGYVKKGVSIIKDGTKLIGDFKEGEFLLHRNYYDSLLKVSPAIAGNKKAKAIPPLYEQMQSRSLRLLQSADSAELIATHEKKALRLVLEDLWARLQAEMGEFELVITPGRLSLSDDERIALIEKAYERLLAMNAYQKTLYQNTITLLRGRSDGVRDIRIIRALQGIEK